MNRDVITVDGLGASGKSALAKELARRLGYGHLNSGLLYRAVAYAVVQEGGKDLRRCEDVMAVLSHRTLKLVRGDDGGSIVELDGSPLGDELSAPAISIAASLVARHQAVRDLLLPIQREAFLPGGVVAEGRDMGTVVFPQAQTKFFVTADIALRSERRYKQLRGTPQEESLESIRTALEERDFRDCHSEVGATKQADGALVIDNGTRSLEETVQEMLQCLTRAA
jgi:cytidylate kinase